MNRVGPSGERAEAPERYWTVPNALCVLRLLCSPALLVLAVQDRRGTLVLAFLLLTVSDWLDGKLAILLDQRSRIGPVLDTIADAVMYAFLAAAALWLDGPRLAAEWPLLALALMSWALLVISGLVRFRRWPALHTRPAKIAWALSAIGAVTFLGGWSTWPLRLALVAVFAANLYAIAVLFTLREWRADVSSLARARSLRRSAGDEDV